MMFPKVLILALLIFGTFATLGSMENLEERFEAIERKLAACTMADEMGDIGTNRGLLTSTQQQMINLVSLTYLPFKLTHTLVSLINVQLHEQVPEGKIHAARAY